MAEVDELMAQLILQQMLNARQGNPMQIPSADYAEPEYQDLYGDWALNAGRQNDLLSDYAGLLMSPEFGMATGTFDYAQPGMAGGYSAFGGGSSSSGSSYGGSYGGSGGVAPPMVQTSAYLNGADETAALIAQRIAVEGMSPQQALSDLDPMDAESYSTVASAVWDEKIQADTAMAQPAAQAPLTPAQMMARNAGLPDPMELYLYANGNMPQSDAMNRMQGVQQQAQQQLGASQDVQGGYGMAASTQSYGEPTGSGMPAWSAGSNGSQLHLPMTVLGALQRQQTTAPPATYQGYTPRYYEQRAQQQDRYVTGQQGIYERMLRTQGQTPYNDMFDARAQALASMLGMG